MFSIYEGFIFSSSLEEMFTADFRVFRQQDPRLEKIKLSRKTNELMAKQGGMLVVVLEGVWLVKRWRKKYIFKSGSNFDVGGGQVLQ